MGDTGILVAVVEVNAGLAELPIMPNTKYRIDFVMDGRTVWSQNNYVWELPEPYIDAFGNYCYQERVA
jgi:hypothetical protein